MGLIDFLRVAAKDPLGVGAVMPSSGLAVRRIVRCLPDQVRTVIEYGPGDGVITRQLLDRLPPDGRLLAIEANHDFYRRLLAIDDPRLTLVLGDAREARAYADREGFGPFDAAVSGIPFSMLSAAERESVVNATHELLSENGVFLVYQVSPLMRKPLKARFAVRTYFAPFNVPPYFIMRAAKDAGL